MVSLWAVNASPIVLLVKVGRIDLLRHLGPPVVVPTAVVQEIHQYGAQDPAVQALASAPWLAVVDPGPIPAVVAAYPLGAGESAVLAYTLANPGCGAILDDRGARRAAAKLGVPHQGTVGLVIHAKQSGLIPAARPIIQQLRLNGLYVSDQIVNQALASVGE